MSQIPPSAIIDTIQDCRIDFIGEQRIFQLAGLIGVENQFHIWVTCMKGFPNLGDIEFHVIIQHTKMQFSLCRSIQTGQLIQHIFIAFQQLCKFFPDDLSGICQFKGISCTFYQLYPQFLFQGSHVAAQCRLCNIQFLRRSGKVLRLRQLQKFPHNIQLHVSCPHEY